MNQNLSPALSTEVKLLLGGLLAGCALAAWKRWSYKLDVTFSSGPFWHHLNIGWWRVGRAPSPAPTRGPASGKATATSAAVPNGRTGS